MLVKRYWRVVGFVCAAMLAGVSFGQSTAVVPPAGASTAGSGGNSIPLGNWTSGVYQVLYNANQLSAIPAGSVITGLQLRLSNFNPSSFPASALTISRFDIRLGTSARTSATMTSTFADNLLNPVVVRSGQFNLAANAYTNTASGSTPEAWGPVIPFTTNYAYGGGPLVIEFRTESPSNTFQHSADGMFSSASACVAASPSTAETGGSVSSSNIIIVRLTFTAPVEPFQSGVTKLIVLDDYVNQLAPSGSSTLVNSDARTAQSVISQAEMRRLGLGSEIVGVGYRSQSTTTWPTAAQVFTKYDIQLSRSLTTVAGLSDTVANNVGPDAVMVRSGAMSVAANSLPGRTGGRPAPWSFEIPFTTPYSYTGGSLLSVVRHDGVTGGVPTFLDSVASGNPGWGTRVKGGYFVGSSISPTTSFSMAVPVQRLSVDAASVVPNVNTTTAGAFSGLNSPLVGSAATSQFIVHASELGYIPVGSQITAISFRGIGASSVPAIPFLFNDYDIYVSSAARRPGSASTTFASNEGSDIVQVRSGPLVLLANSFPGGAVPNLFGPTIHFQRAFVYQGGDLCVTLRHSGFGTGVAIPLDATTDATLCRTVSSLGQGALTGNVIAGGPVVRLGYTPSVVAPSVNSNLAGNIGYSLLFSDAGNVYQAVYAADQLRSLRIGSVITGMSLRQQSFSGFYPNWPSADVAVNRFDITLSTSPVPPQLMSEAFASNIGSDAIVVKSGPLTIPAGAIPFAGVSTRPNENLWFIQFTEPFVYKGGPLSMTIRSDSGAMGYSCYLDTNGTAPFQASGRWSFGAGADATSHNQGEFKGAVITRFAFVPKSYCAADMNNDGVVDDGDFSVFVVAYDKLECNDPTMPVGCPADLNFDRIVDDSDFSIFIVAYDALLCP